MFKRLSDGSVISEDFIKLHYPGYRHNDLFVADALMALHRSGRL